MKNLWNNGSEDKGKADSGAVRGCLGGEQRLERAAAQSVFILLFECIFLP